MSDGTDAADAGDDDYGPANIVRKDWWWWWRSWCWWCWWWWQWPSQDRRQGLVAVTVVWSSQTHSRDFPHRGQYHTNAMDDIKYRMQNYIKTRTKERKLFDTMYVTNFEVCVSKMPCSIRKARCRMCFLINSQFWSFPATCNILMIADRAQFGFQKALPGAKSGLLVSICLAHNASTQIWPYSPSPDWSLLMWSACCYYCTQNIIVINFINDR